MKILMDECVPWPMHKLLLGHECTTAQKRGWAAVKNGDLLRLAEGQFDLFITSDQNLRYQQNLAGPSPFLFFPPMICGKLWRLPTKFRPL
jgi:hypothetical protein